MGYNREKQLTKGMEEKKIDAFLSLLPENILFFSGCWPSTAAAVIYPKDETPTLILPKPDEDFVPSNWKGEVLIYNTRLDDDPPDLFITKLIRESLEKKKLLSAQIGCDRNMETVAGTHIGGEAHVPGIPFYTLLNEQFPKASFIDHTKWLEELRMIKTDAEIEALKRCNEIVDHSMAEARKYVKPGMKETELSAVIESAIQTFGVGHKNVKRARGFAFVMSGPKNTATAWGAYNISTDRVIKEGDLILIELDTQADGYWSDISRTFYIGEPTAKHKQVWDAVREAQEKTIQSLHAGDKISSVDECARNILRNKGYGDHFLHHVGHGVGFAFHEPPYLDPPNAIQKDYEITPGMVLAIEPAVYIDGWGGIRIEDNVVITESGTAEYLTHAAKDL
jgi:Xaa-Pro aminopeptidase